MDITFFARQDTAPARPVGLPRALLRIRKTHTGLSPLVLEQSKLKESIHQLTFRAGQLYALRVMAAVLSR